MGLRGPGAKPVKRQKRRRTPRRNSTVSGKATLSRAERVCRFIQRELRITSGMHAGQPFKLRPWQKKIIAALYATDSDNRRIKRSALISVPRKNGKTSLAAAL